MTPYPTSATPYGFAPPPPPTKSSAWTIVLGIVAGVLLLAAGGAGTLYYLEHDKAQKTNADQQAQIHDLQEQLKQAQDDLNLAGRDLSDAQADAKSCTDAVQALFDFEPTSTNGQLSQADVKQINDLTLAVVRACDVG